MKLDILMKKRINEIIELLKNIKKKDLEIINEKEFIHQIMMNYNVTERKAKEYLGIAKYRLKKENEM